MVELDEIVLAWVGRFVDEHGYSPTLREVMDGVGSASFRAVHASLNRLREVGMLTWQDGTSRTLRVVANGGAQRSPGS